MVYVTRRRPRRAACSSARTSSTTWPTTRSGRRSRNRRRSNYSSTDTRVRWCCRRRRAATRSSATRPRRCRGTSTRATGARPSRRSGNNAFAVHNWDSNDPFTVGTEPATPRPDRDYDYTWTNQWYDAALQPGDVVHLAAAQRHRRRPGEPVRHAQPHARLVVPPGLHRGDVEHAGRSTSARRAGRRPRAGQRPGRRHQRRPAGFAARDNANQITPPDGLPPITNMYLWQPIAGAFYAPCVDGDYDMSVIGHEYTPRHLQPHGRPARTRACRHPGAGAWARAGPTCWRSSTCTRTATCRSAARTRSPSAPYVTGDPVGRHPQLRHEPQPAELLRRRLRLRRPAAGDQVHADGEIWSATNYRHPRRRSSSRYGAGDAALQESCAAGRTPVTACPGNRRWIQLVFDSLLLMADRRNVACSTRATRCSPPT